MMLYVDNYCRGGYDLESKTVMNYYFHCGNEKKSYADGSIANDGYLCGSR